MDIPLHITSGDRAGGRLAQAGLPGEVFVWHDILYDGPRRPGWPDDEALNMRALFLEQATGGGLKKHYILETLQHQYRRLSQITPGQPTVLWFDACLFDQSMLVHILTCLQHLGHQDAELLCIDSFSGIEPYNGLGQLRPAQLASCFDRRCPISEAQWNFAARVDRAFATQDTVFFAELAAMRDAPLPWVPAAVARWCAEQPDPDSGLGLLEELALAAIRSGCTQPGEIFASVAAADEPPQYWGDTTLWAKINGLADRHPPLVKIEGPADRLPQWDGAMPLKDFTITARS